MDVARLSIVTTSAETSTWGVSIRIAGRQASAFDIA